MMRGGGATWQAARKPAAAVLGGVVLALVATRTTLNIQSFMGAIMAIGVAVANAILLANFAEENRRGGKASNDAAVEGAQHRLQDDTLRPV